MQEVGACYVWERQVMILHYIGVYLTSLVMPFIADHLLGSGLMYFSVYHEEHLDSV